MNKIISIFFIAVGKKDLTDLLKIEIKIKN
jgi:hypothetical protein